MPETNAAMTITVKTTVTATKCQYSVTFTKKDTYPYACIVHPGMIGKVGTVLGAFGGFCQFSFTEQFTGPPNASQTDIVTVIRFSQIVERPVGSFGHLALFARFASREEESFAAKVNAALRNQFGGHAVQAASQSGDGAR